MKTQISRKRINQIVSEELAKFLVEEDEKKGKETPPHAISKAASEFKAAVSKSLKQAVKESLEGFKASVKKFDESGIPKMPDELTEKLAGISDGMNQMSELLDQLDPVISEIEEILDHMINNPGEYIVKPEEKSFAQEYPAAVDVKSPADGPMISG
jgi:hypothetical protein